MVQIFYKQHSKIMQVHQRFSVDALPPTCNFIKKTHADVISFEF